jgi:hypothetical protein
MKHQLTKKLTLYRETIRTLTDSEAMMAAGGATAITAHTCGTCYSCIDCTLVCPTLRGGSCDLFCTILE